MKKILCLTALFGLFVTSCAFSETGNVMITSMQGDVQIKRGDKMIPAKPGMSCQKGDGLITGSNCSVDISVNKLAGVRLLASSSGTITNPQKESMMINVNSGNAILNLNKLPKGSSFKVETPTAVASVRGTQFWGRVVLPSREARLNNIQSPETTTTTFAVREGTVDILVKAAGKKFALKPGQALDIPKNETDLSVRLALPAEMEAMKQADSIPTA